MSKHTPGPWHLNQSELADDFQLADAEEMRICYIPQSRYVDERKDPEQQANARLIAAAPELLDALRVLADCAEAWLPEKQESRAISVARAAIRKAEK